MIARLALCEQQGQGAPLPVADGVELRVQPALGAADAAGKSPFLRRLAAVRCAVRGVASIISRDGGPASAASAAKMRSNTPPADEAVVARLVRAVGRGRIAPAEAVADHRDDPAQHTTVSYARNAMRQRTVRRQAPNLRKRQQNASVSRTGAVGLAMAEPPTHPEPHPPASLRTLIGPEPRRDAWDRGIGWSAGAEGASATAGSRQVRAHWSDWTA